MIPVSQMIKNLTNEYKEISVECMQNLCDKAGVQYREHHEAEQLLEDMHNEGYRIKVSKYTNKDISVGQYIILTDLDLNVVKGYRVYIDFEGFAVRKMNITENAEVPFLKGELH